MAGPVHALLSLLVVSAASSSKPCSDYTDTCAVGEKRLNGEMLKTSFNECCYKQCSDAATDCDDGYVLNGADNCYASEYASGGGGCKEKCCVQTCFTQFTGQCENGKMKRAEDNFHVPSSKNFDADECCVTDNTCGTNAANDLCVDPLILRATETCEVEDGSLNCESDKCCAHPLEDKCGSDKALECSTCAKFAPCTSSIDPRCISQEALDCLPCKDQNVTECAECAPGWDGRCQTRTIYDEPGCQGNIKYILPERVDGYCRMPWFGSGGYQKTEIVKGTPNGTYSNFGKCSSKDCSEQSCEDVTTNMSFVFAAQFGVCEEKEDDDESELREASFDLPANPCNHSGPCGPEACTPGVDEKCVVFTVFGNTSTCEAVNITNYSDVGDFYAFATADDTCRQDGSGRSYYKLTLNRATASGTGLLGCADSACSQNCSVVNMITATCATPEWSNGLQLVASAVLEDFPLVTTTVAPTAECDKGDSLCLDSGVARIDVSVTVAAFVITLTLL